MFPIYDRMLDSLGLEMTILAFTFATGALTRALKAGATALKLEGEAVKLGIPFASIAIGWGLLSLDALLGGAEGSAALATGWAGTVLAFGAVFIHETAKRALRALGLPEELITKILGKVPGIKEPS